MSYLCKMQSIPTETDAKLKLINPSNYSLPIPATVGDVDNTSITFTNKENLQNYLNANCYDTSTLSSGNGTVSMISFIILILLIASIVYLMMPKKVGNNSFGFAKSSFTF